MHPLTAAHIGWTVLRGGPLRAKRPDLRQKRRSPAPPWEVPTGVPQHSSPSQNRRICLRSGHQVPYRLAAADKTTFNCDTGLGNATSRSMPVRLADICQDLRYGFRSLLKTPGFSAAALVTLALGIGANTSIFTMVDAVLLRPLPYSDPDRLATVWDQHPQRTRAAFSEPRLFEARRSATGLEHVAGFNDSGFNLSGAGLPERVDGMSVSWDFFDTLGTHPFLGRSFRQEEDRPGASRVAVLSYSLWQRQF